MVMDSIRNLIADKEPTPNKFTIAMGELIRKAREEAGLSQAELAKRIYRRRATISDMENGKAEVSSSVLALLSASLEKPITYFYPPFIYRELKQDEFTPQDQELLTHFKNIDNDHLRKLAIDQVRIIAEFEPKEMFIDEYEHYLDELKLEEEGIQLLANRLKRR
jgi:transcriptional regulator with XRE-family HTH domain